METFYDHVGAEAKFGFTDFWCASPEWSAMERKEVHKHRVTPVCDLDELRYVDLLLPSVEDRLDDYRAKLEEDLRLAKVAGDDVACFELEQNPKKRPRIWYEHRATGSKTGTGHLSTMLSHGTVWNEELERWLLAVESACCHGYAVEPDHIAQFVTPLRWDELLQSSIVTCSQLKSMIGNGWHLMSVLKWIMFLLASIEPRDHGTIDSPLIASTDVDSDDEADDCGTGEINDDQESPDAVENEFMAMQMDEILPIEAGLQ